MTHGFIMTEAELDVALADIRNQMLQCLAEAARTEAQRQIGLAKIDRTIAQMRKPQLLHLELTRAVLNDEVH
jgi:hypothetical protein